jgi:hypothetical protein
MSYDSATDVLYASSSQRSWSFFGFSKRYGSLPTDIRLELPESMTIALPKELAIA